MLGIGALVVIGERARESDHQGKAESRKQKAEIRGANAEKLKS
jgi:hypothetical protein